MALARTRLVLGRDAQGRFFAHLAFRWAGDRTVIDWQIDTAATDGERLYVNPEFVLSLSATQLVGLLCHEVMHIVLSHHARRGGRDPRRWNIACDLAINPIVRDAGFSLPEGGLFPGAGPFSHMPEGLSSGEYYDLLEEDDCDGEQAGGEGKPGEGPAAPVGAPGVAVPAGAQVGHAAGRSCPDPGRCGGVIEPGDGSPADCQQAEAQAQVAVAQAHAEAKSRGSLPGGLTRLVTQVLAPKVDWKDVLREFVSRQARNDFSWSRPNRRYIHQGLYLPGLHSEELGDVVLAVDTSGSISARELDRFAAEITGILEAYDCTLVIVYHDCRVQHVQTWRSSDGPLVLEPKGGGGTSHVPVFDHLAKMADPPTCIVCLTDMYSSFPDRAPDVPVLWASTTDVKGPWGTTVKVSV